MNHRIWKSTLLALVLFAAITGLAAAEGAEVPQTPLQTTETVQGLPQDAAPEELEPLATEADSFSQLFAPQFDGHCIDGCSTNNDCVWYCEMLGLGAPACINQTSERCSGECICC